MYDAHNCVGVKKFSTANLWQCLNSSDFDWTFSPHRLLLRRLSSHQHGGFPAEPAAALLAAFLFLLWLSLNILPHKCRSALMRSAALIRVYWNRHARIHSAYTKWIVNAKQLYCSKMLKNGKGNWSQMLFRVFDRTSYPVRFFLFKSWRLSFITIAQTKFLNTTPSYALHFELLYLE